MSSARTHDYACTIVDSINELCNRALSEYAYEDVAEAVDERKAELVAIGARIRDWSNLKRRIEFLTMVADRITFLGVLRNEGISLRLVNEDRFVATPSEMDPEIRDWIVNNRAAIAAELKAASNGRDGR